MGAWGHGSFENDGALDFLGEFSEEQDVQLLLDAFNGVINDDAEGDEAIAAAEIVAGIKGKINPAFPEYYLNDSDDQFENINFEKLKTLFTEELEQKAIKAIRIVRDSESSELRCLWEESGEFDDWKKAVNELEARLIG